MTLVNQKNNKFLNLKNKAKEAFKSMDIYMLGQTLNLVSSQKQLRKHCEWTCLHYILASLYLSAIKVKDMQLNMEEIMGITTVIILEKTS